MNVPRPSNSANTELYLDGKRVVVGPPIGSASMEGQVLHLGPDFAADLGPLMDVLRLLSRTLYIGPFRNAINLGAMNPYFDMRIGQAFIQQWDELRSGNVKANQRFALRVVDDLRKIFGYQHLEIAAAADNQSLLFTVDGESYDLREMGSGLTQFFLVLANAAIAQPSLILIDEPELSLHPSLQSEFLQSLTSYAEHGVVFATHNLGLAMDNSDQVYSVRKVGQNPSEVTDFDAYPRLPEFLGEMGFSGYRQLGFDKVLLVEGPSDVRVAQQLLRKLGQYREVLVLSLGGGSMINKTAGPQLREVARASDHVFALIDSEKANPKATLDQARKGFRSACRAAGIEVHVLERRAMENYFPERAIQAVKGTTYRELGPYEKLSEASTRWGKAENWRIARAMSKAEFSATNDLIAFFQGLVAPSS